MVTVAVGKDVWYPWLQTELEKLGVVCETPNLPDPVEAKASVWLPNDPYIDISEPQLIRDKLSAEYHELPGQGHFTGTLLRRKRTFPELLSALKKKIDL